MKLNKEKFLKTELGTNLRECITAWDKALSEIRMYSSSAQNRDEYQRALKTVAWCQAQWEVHQIVLKQFYDIDCRFSCGGERCGIVLCGDSDEYLFEVKR